jgi:hypothetical protein
MMMTFAKAITIYGDSFCKQSTSIDGVREVEKISHDLEWGYVGKVTGWRGVILKSLIDTVEIIEQDMKFEALIED